MAAVWAGTDTRLDRPVAVKVLDAAAQVDPVMLERLDREARSVARLAHPNIVSVYDIGTEHGLPYLVMELVEGENLQQRLADGPLDVRQAVGIATQVCDALTAAHQAGVVHRDIKPDNILLTRTGTVKLCDFGIARLQQATRVRVTDHATAVGTSEYMAPEQAAGGPVDARTDLYALGCLLYAMLSGAPPFTGDNPMHVLWQHMHQTPAPVVSHRPAVPGYLDTLVGRLLAKDPTNRPATAGEVGAQLTGVPDQPATPVTLQSAGLTPAHPARATATVVSRTRTMPVPEGDELPPARRGGGLGPAGVTAVAVSSAVVAAVLVGLLLLAALPGSQGTPPAGPAAPATTGPTTPASPTVAPGGTVEAALATLQAQVLAGQVDDKAASDLNDRLDEIARYLADGQPVNAAKKAEEARRKLAEFRRDGRITTAAYQAMLPSLEQLAAGFPRNERDDNDDDDNDDHD
jgi:serine/threonine-protein kinase